MDDLDTIDRKILSILEDNGRISNTDLADEVGLTPAPCLRRVRRLEEEGYIQKYTAVLNPNKVGRNLMVFVMVTLDRQTKAGYDRFAQAICKHPEVLECHLLLGDRDFLLKIRVPDLASYQQFYLKHLTTPEGIRHITSLIVIQEEKGTLKLLP